jgi:hypothetical protein
VRIAFFCGQREYVIKKVVEKVPVHVYVMHPKFIDVHAILDGWRVNRGVRGCVKTVLPLCVIKGLKNQKSEKNRNNVKNHVKIRNNFKK